MSDPSCKIGGSEVEKCSVSVTRKEVSKVGNYHSTPNTLSAEAFGLTTEESKTLTSNVYPEVTFAYTNKTRGVLNGEDKTQTLHKATEYLFLDREGELPDTYKVTDLWVTSEGLTLTEVAEAKALSTHTVKNKSRKAPWYNKADYKTVYANCKTATDVVTTARPTAVGFVEGYAELWADYLAGGNGALANKKLTKELLEDDWKSVCCKANAKTVAGIRLCKKCGGEFVSAEGEGA